MMNETDTSKTTENNEQPKIKDIYTGDVFKFKKRMLQWPNPVEYVNNMYGCHPDDKENDYFKVIFSK